MDGEVLHAPGSACHLSSMFQGIMICNNYYNYIFYMTDPFIIIILSLFIQLSTCNFTLMIIIKIIEVKWSISLLHDIDSF